MIHDEEQKSWRHLYYCLTVVLLTAIGGITYCNSQPSFTERLPEQQINTINNHIRSVVDWPDSEHKANTLLILAERLRAAHKRPRIGHSHNDKYQCDQCDKGLDMIPKKD